MTLYWVYSFLRVAYSAKKPYFPDVKNDKLYNYEQED